MAKTLITCTQKAIQLLSRREYSYKELYKKLLTYAYTEQEVEECLTKLGQKNLQNDTRFSEYIARKNINKGSLKLIQELKQHNLSEENIQLAQNILCQQGNELERAQKAWEKKFSSKNNTIIYDIEQEQSNHTTNKQELYLKKQKQQQKYLRFLLSQGFSYEICIKILKDK